MRRNTLLALIFLLLAITIAGGLGVARIWGVELGVKSDWANAMLYASHKGVFDLAAYEASYKQAKAHAARMAPQHRDARAIRATSSTHARAATLTTVPLRQRLALRAEHLEVADQHRPCLRRLDHVKSARLPSLWRDHQPHDQEHRHPHHENIRLAGGRDESRQMVRRGRVSCRAG